MNNKKASESRRKLLKSIAAGSGAVIAGKSLPENWTKPVVDSVILPAHAQMTCCDIAGKYCADGPGVEYLEINVSADGSVTILWLSGQNPQLTGTATVTCSGGTFNATVTGGAAAPITAIVTGTIGCGQAPISGTVDGTAYTATTGLCGMTGPSDRNIKDNFSAVNEQEILSKVANLSIEHWNYTDREEGVRHIGPMAQDFMAAFNVGDSDRHIHMIDANGVNLAAIKALNEKLTEKDAQIQSLQEQMDALMQKIDRLG